jgi:serum/glucocorticoid-regulated kinase 2
VKPPYKPNKFKFNFDEEEFGRGESEFLGQMSIVQQNVMENYPRKVLLKGFYYNLYESDE